MVEAISQRRMARAEAQPRPQPNEPLPAALAKVLPIVDLLKPKPEPKPASKTVILPRENHPEILTEAKRVVDPDRSYTRTEAAELSGIPRSRWLRWTRPSDMSRAPKVQSSKPGTIILIQGTEIVRIMEELSEIPTETRNLRELSAALGRSHEGVKHDSVEQHSDGKYFVYKRNSDGRQVLVPLYRDLDGQNLLVSERDFAYIASDHKSRNDLFEWAEARQEMISRGVDLVAAELQNHRTSDKIVHSPDGKHHIRYLSPSGVVTKVPAQYLTRKCGDGQSYQIRREDLNNLIAVIKLHQSMYVQLQDLRAELGVSQSLVSPFLNSSGRWFSLDGQKIFIKLYRRHKTSGISFVRSSDAEFFRRWMAFRNEKKKHVVVKEAVCKKPKLEATERYFNRFKAGIVKKDRELVYSLSSLYGLAVRVREFDGKYFVKKGHDALLRFHLSITHPTPRVQTRTIRALLKEAKGCDKSNLFLMYKLWMARDKFIHTPETGNGMIVTLDKLLKHQKVVVRFKKYPLTQLERTVSTSVSDLRYFPLDAYDTLLALVSRQSTDIYTQFASMWQSL